MEIIDRKNQTFINEVTGKQENYYTRKDIQQWKWILVGAEALWQRLAEEYGKDEGSCILGDCIKAKVLLPRKRYIRYIEIVPSPSFQGSITKEVTVKPVLEFLKSKGIECWYHEGRMD